jgi:hypothetical protein
MAKRKRYPLLRDSPLASKKLAPQGTVVRGGYLITFDSTVASALSQPEPGSCIGREIPRAEVGRFLPGMAPAARLFEPAPACWFIAGKPGGEMYTSKIVELGKHGHWPTRYRASFAIAGPGIKAEHLPEMDMRDAVKNFADILSLAWPPHF